MFQAKGVAITDSCMALEGSSAASSILPTGIRSYRYDPMTSVTFYLEISVTAFDGNSAVENDRTDEQAREIRRISQDRVLHDQGAVPIEG